MTQVMTNTTPQRARCLTCRRPESACICRWVRPVANDVELLILQHPLEQHEAKGTGLLLHLSLARGRLLVGERFDPADLGAMAGTALLYPGGADELPGAPITRLILIDATWRKSRKMLHLNPFLQSLPRLALKDPPASRYAPLRRAHQPQQLSTLEAGVQALQQLELLRPERYAPLLGAFEGFVGHGAGRAGPYNPAPKKTT